VNDSSEYKNSPEYKEFISRVKNLKLFFDSLPFDNEVKALIWQELAQLFSLNKDIILPPRREEILAIIKDHKDVTFDFLKRRFYGIPARTLSYDLKKLADLGFIVKVGKTRGSFYRAK